MIWIGRVGGMIISSVRLFSRSWRGILRGGRVEVRREEKEDRLSLLRRIVTSCSVYMGMHIWTKLSCLRLSSHQKKFVGAMNILASAPSFTPIHEGHLSHARAASLPKANMGKNCNVI